MRQLLGLAFNKLVRPSLSFRGFRHRAGCNPHGWLQLSQTDRPRSSRSHFTPRRANWLYVL